VVRFVVAALLCACGVLTTASAAADPKLILHGPRTERWVALTFDADMTQAMISDLHSGKVKSWYDHQVIATLRRTHTPATIFLTGLWTKTYPNAVRSLARGSLFELENHSWDHAAWAGSCYGLPAVRSPARKRAEVLRTEAIVKRVAGVKTRYFRFPGGCLRKADVRLVWSLGQQPVQWDVISGDSFLTEPGRVEQEVLRQVQPGSIVVMHLVGPARTPATAPAVEALIPKLRARGYRFVTLRKLLASRPATRP
jgi:peptidoglycan/xylan/chitin deacetylase (PgdA/CDA1 family)